MSVYTTALDLTAKGLLKAYAAVLSERKRHSITSSLTGQIAVVEQEVDELLAKRDITSSLSHSSQQNLARDAISVHNRVIRIVDHKESLTQDDKTRLRAATKKLLVGIFGIQPENADPDW